MKNNYPYLKDKTFLQQLINLKITNYYVKIYFLDWAQRPIKEIQQKAISGNFNLDGNSAIRRTATLSLILEDQSAQELMSLNRKVKIQIGYENHTGKYENYPVLWFPLGVYVITDVNFSHSVNDSTVSMQFKDKMCLLNGDCGGRLAASVVFDNAESIDDQGNIIITRPTIYQIIKELVNHFGGEQLSKIIVSDLDTRVKQVMKWMGSSPLYFLKKNDQYFLTVDVDEYQDKISEGFQDVDGSPFPYNTDVGFIYTDFSYPGELIGNVGDTICDILDNIKNVLGNYEYFYDLDGNFVFQQIKNYLNNAQSKYIIDSLNSQKFLPDYLAETGESYLTLMRDGKSVFSFKKNNQIITSCSNNPQLNKIKNDFVVWGVRQDSQGFEFPIRYHLAIDKKPSVGNTYSVFKYVDLDGSNLEKWYAPLKFENINAFPEKGMYGVFYLAEDTGIIYQWKMQNDLFQYVVIDATIENITTTDWRTELYFQGVAAEPYGTESNYYYTELLNEWPKLYDIRQGHFKEEAVKNPSGIDYYLDFLDPRGSKILNKFSIDNIGRRTYASENGKNNNCVFEAYIPDIVLIKAGGQNTQMAKLREQCEQRNQAWYQVSEDIYDNLIGGGTLYSCYEQIKQTLQEYVGYNQNISIQTLPVYFLQPNTCIEVQDEVNNISGNYMINTMSFSLDSSGTLAINATRMLQKI